MDFTISIGRFPTLAAPIPHGGAHGGIRLETASMELTSTVSAEIASFSPSSDSFCARSENPKSQCGAHGGISLDMLLLELASTLSAEIPCFSTASISFLDKSGIPKPRPLADGIPLCHRALTGAVAGGVAGAFTYACLHPLDTLKTKLQARSSSGVYSSAVDAAVKTFQSSGVLGFYSGVTAAVAGSAFSSAVYFGTCEYGKSLLARLPQLPPLAVPPLAGAMGNIMSSAIMVPKEVVTQRMQAGAAGGAVEVARGILAADGALGLYAGYSATLLRNLPAGVLNYSCFEYLKAAVLRWRGAGNLAAAESICCGAVAGAVSAALTTPMDVVKTRLMTGEVGGGAAAVYGGVVTTVRRILAEEGWRGLARGVGPRVLHSACFSAVGYLAFETARVSILRQYAAEDEEGSGGAAASPTGDDDGESGKGGGRT